MKKLKMTLRTTFFLIAFTTIANMSFAQCWFVDDATNSVCMTEPTNSCIPITYPNGATAFSIEALSIDPSGSPVYASDGGQVGILDPISGIFTPFANPSGYTDIDGLAWDPNANKLFASVRLVNQNDLLVCIEISGPNAGLPVAGTQVVVTGSGDDVDELTVPPNSCSNAGIIFATIDIGGSFVLATIDPASGVATELGPIGIPDVESITFDANCNLYGNTGSGALYLLDQNTGAAIGDPILNVNGNDVEGMSCESSTPFGASISNYIWEDTNGDGVQGAGEDPIAGVIVNLLDAAGNPVLDPAGNPITAVTDANGEYIFDNLPAGDYIVEIDPSNFAAGGALEGYAQTFDEDGGDDGQIAVSLDANEDHITADFGFQGTGTIGDTIFEDLDGDGVQGPGEMGIPGVTVELFDSMGNSLGTAVTDANGNYLFDELPAGDYTVTVTPPADYVNSADPDGAFDDTADVTLGPNEDNLDQDFGYEPLGSIGDTIFEDLDGDGVQGPGEMGIPGVTVELFDSMGNSLGTAVTDANGNYLFDELPAGDYTVTVTPPADYVNSADPDGAFDDTADVTLGPNEDNLDQDFGYEPLGSIGDTIFEDLDGDGVQGPGEMGIPGVTVELFDSMGNSLGTAVTDANGNYLFDELPAGDYTVTVTPPAGYDNTADPDGLLDDTADVTLGIGEDNTDQDFGYEPNGSIGDTIYEDLDGDGMQGPGEMGIPGVTVELFDDMGNSLGTTMTDANGNYIFENLPAGDYTVTVTPPAGYTNTGDPDGTFDSTTDVTLGAGEMTTVEDFGYQGTGSIGDLIWEDLNGDGVVDPGEMGMAGVTVELKDSLCVVIATTMTDANGNYIFDNLPPGDYTILVTPPAGFDNTGDPDGTMDNTSMVTLATDGIMMGQDFGYDMIVVAVDIMFFNAKKNNKYVDLEWALAYDGDLDYVEIQHSMDGVNYQAVKNGDSDLIAYTHTKTKAGSNYYRLVFHEYNGEITISNTKVIRFAQAEVIKIYPTLVSEQLNIDGAIINQYAIYGLDGKLIKQGLNDANGYQTIDLLDLPDGNYMIRMESTSGQVLSKQFMKIN